MATIAAEDFDYLRKIVLQEAAIVLAAGKEYLAQSRLEPLARERGLPDVGALVKAMRTDATGRIKAEIVDAMTTNETLFFRDVHPFETLRSTIIPDLIEKRRSQRSLDIWCAAASTGQEPYSILMVLKEFPELATWRIRLLGTDISESAIARAKDGKYSQMEVNRGLPMKQLITNFTRVGTEWQINQEFRAAAQYKLFNLASNWPTIGPFDLVFMRNVLIYFSAETKQQIIDKVARVVRPDGYFMLGSTESLMNIKTNFQRVQHGKSTCYTVG